MSVEAITFLKKLIVSDKDKRAGWRRILQDPYLMNSPKIEGLDLSECVFPLETIDWKQVQMDMDKDMQKKVVQGVE